MAGYIIEGGKKLSGSLTVSGSKNASLPIIAGTILINGITTLYNVPDINDIKITLKILSFLGCKVHKKNGKVTIDTRSMHNHEIPHDLMRQMRSSVVLAGAIIGRFKNAAFSYPGGCDIGARPIDLHLKGFQKLGIKIEENSGNIRCRYDKIINGKINLDFPSVGATENLIFASVLSDGETIISNAAMEPEIVDLQKFLNKAGAKISGAGTSEIRITGVKKLNEIKYTIMPDRIEAGTLLCGAAITGGFLELKNVIPEHISPVLHKLEECGCKIQTSNRIITLEAPKRLQAVDIKTTPYPGFPTDMQSVFLSILTVAKGTSLVIENIFENRFKYTNELKRMGAKITIEGKTAVIKGTKKLYGAQVKSTDLRGGAALVIAALSAKGITKIDDIEHILRGYEKLDIKLNSIGADIKLYK